MTVNAYAALGRGDFLRLAQQLLPRGDAWPHDPEAGMTQVLAGIAAEQAAVHARVGDLSERESDPAQTVELLPDWERAFGLPDSCISGPQTLQQRRAALVARIAAMGGQSIPILQAVAASLGFTITVTRFKPFCADESCADDPLYDEGAYFVARINAPAETITYFAADCSCADDPLAAWGNAQLECELNRMAAAHGHLTFAYGD
jgi:uncharacterized protein YmfQ (DUF2313 family)